MTINYIHILVYVYPLQLKDDNVTVLTKRHNAVELLETVDRANEMQVMKPNLLYSYSSKECTGYVKVLTEFV